MFLKGIIEKNFKYFFFFFSYLRFKIFVLVAMSLLVGLLDGFGLALFIPLFQVAVDDTGQTTKPELGELDFLLDFMDTSGFNLTVPNILIFMTLLFLFKGVFKFCDSYYKVSLQIFFVKKLRFQMLNGMENVSFQNFVGMDAGRIQNTLSAEVYKVTASFISYFNTLQYAVLLLVYMGLAFISNWQFAILVSIGGFISNLFFKILFSRTETASIAISSKGHVFQSFLIQAVQHFKYLKATAFFRNYKQKLTRQIDEIEGLQKKIGLYNSILNGLREPIILIIVILVILVQVSLLGGSLSSILLSLMFFYRALNYVISVQSSWQTFISQFGGIVSSTEIIKMFDEGVESNHGTAKMGPLQRISLQNVGFGFKDGHQILENIDLEITEKQTIAFVGPSGSGKTTLVNLIVGLFNPNEGNIYVNGLERSEIDMVELRSKVGYITQEPVIFNDSVYNNVTFWAPKNPENIARFWKAIAMANLEEFVLGLRGKEEMILGDNGVKASGGQKQRISIARELYKEVEIIVFDEATSALDSDSEKVIQENINSLQGQFTIILIAHRLSTVKKVDKIYLVDQGGIKASGEFEQLFHSNADFRRMVQLQEF